MTEDDKWKIKGCFHKWVITDPYPELTEWDQHAAMMQHDPVFFGLFGKTKPEKHLGPRPTISAHKAWREGYEFAKNLVTKELES